MRPVVLIIRDGWGISEDKEGNAVLAADTPNIDRYKKEYPWTRLECSGEAVGLPEGYQGSSEVGHLNIGAGRIVVQELKRIDDGLSTGELFKSPKWISMVERWKTASSRLHLLGLLQDEGVHAHQEHLFKIMRRAREDYPEGEIVIHPFLDGRDTAPRSTLEYFAKLEPVMAEVGRCSVGTVMGRYYAMDRSQNWRLTDMAYDCIVSAKGRPFTTAREAIESAYEQDKTPDGEPMFDEYVAPCVMAGYDGVHDGDCVLHTNYRQDRAIQLALAFSSDDYLGQRQRVPKITFLGLTRYFDEFTEFMMGAMGGDGAMDELLGEVVSKAGLRQLRLAETQKFRHVTSFFNGKSTTPYPGEDQVDVPSRFDPASFGSHPEMEAYNVTEAVLERLKDNPYAFVVINFANGDMVGHTGLFEAARQAIGIVDECVGRITERCLELDAHVLITADHGNSEQMLDLETGMTKTSHTLNPVELIYVARDANEHRLAPSGKLSDIAPTVLKLLGLAIPQPMTADVLLLD